MLHLRQRIVSHIISSPATSSVSPATSAVSSLRRLLSAAAAPVSPYPSGFAIEDYLVDSCGLTRSQAIKAATKLSHLKSPTKPNAVLAFLSGLGLSGADAAAVIAKDPLFLCAGVETTLVPVVDGLEGLGLSRPGIARLMSLAYINFRCRSIVSKMQYYLPLFGSFDNFFRALQRSSYLLSSDLDKVINPNVVFLRECGLDDCDIAKLCIRVPRMLTTNPERVRAMGAYAERLGMPRGSGMYRIALHAVSFLSEEKITAKVDYLKKTFSWSDAEVVMALSKAPMLLKRSKDILRRRFEFLVSEVGLEPAYIAHRPVMLYYSLEDRLMPRCYVLKFLKENGLVDRDLSFSSALSIQEKYFMEKYIRPHNEAAPHLADDYAAACRGEVPASFIFT
ncbi:transcription termination factor MTERF8, chloroplastic [Aegilops tauschii subsp. strangulata]|nr:transcription termination factor MTERF8, chloroplastic [Aegilops tauschii subsp. strangulata]